MKSSSQRKREKRAKVESSGRVKRYRRRMDGIKTHHQRKEVKGHVASLMESLVMRKKAERRKAQQEGSVAAVRQGSRSLKSKK